MDVLCMGEVLIDFTPGKDPGSYIRNPGGGPANTAVSIVKNGLEVGFLGKVGDDDFGRFLVQTLETNQVAVLCREMTKDVITTLAFVSLYENGERSFTFARKPGADMMLAVSDVEDSQIEDCKIIHAGSFSLSQNPSREAVGYALKQAHEKGKIVSFDVNYRDTVWENEEAAKMEVEKILPYVDLLKISDEELYFVGGEEQIFATMEKYSIKVLIETLGSKGAKYYFGGHTGMIEGKSVKAVDATGAGDAFWGGFLARMLLEKVTSTADITEDIVKKALAYGNASGALCVQKMGGIPALPTKEMIEEEMSR